MVAKKVAELAQLKLRITDKLRRDLSVRPRKIIALPTVKRLKG